MTPTATAPTPTAPARMMNARRDQSGMPALGRPRVLRASRGSSGAIRPGSAVAVVVTTGAEMSSSQPRTSRPAPTATAVATARDRRGRERIAERGEEADARRSR